MPVDIEEVGIRARLAPGQHILPPAILRTANRHMVGHDIQDQAHIVSLQAGHQPFQRCFATQFRVDASGVDTIVAVGGAGA